MAQPDGRLRKLGPGPGERRGAAPGTRREQILRTAAVLFARRGYHGVSIAELGAAVGISGPALYRHFPGKEALLAEMLVGISESLLEGARARAAALADAGPEALLEALVDFQLEFSLQEPELIVVHDRDLDSLPEDARRRVRRAQRAYVEIWVQALLALHASGPDARDDPDVAQPRDTETKPTHDTAAKPTLGTEAKPTHDTAAKPDLCTVATPDLRTENAARSAAHAVFGLLNSTPHSMRGAGPDRAAQAALLRRMALSALHAL